MEDIKLRNMIIPTTREKRLTNNAVDITIVCVVALVVGVIMDVPVAPPSGEIPIERNILLFSVMIPYFLLTETIFGKTVGKMVTKTKVIMLDGTKANFWRITVRTICRFLPFDALSFVFSRLPRGWHDRFSGTVVVNE